MILSMTGYGRATKTFGDKTLTVEIRALNSKLTDVRFKMPPSYKEKELDLRRILNEHTERGKVDVSITLKTLSGDDDYAFNHELFEKYLKELRTLSHKLHLKNSDGDFIHAILRLPNVVGSEPEVLADSEWQIAQATVREAVVEFNKYRRIEGASMERDLKERIEQITQNLAAIEPFEAERVTKLRVRLRQNLDEFLGRENIDENRFEQEVLFYLEKIDVSEEKVRLTQHCRYFLDQMAEKTGSSKGRTLNFITQEIGREINTLGSKAYSHDIQKLVVGMKDELEKMKELIANLV
jgi:uncharacterized protein (TIGR00255 family)